MHGVCADAVGRNGAGVFRGDGRRRRGGGVGGETVAHDPARGGRGEGRRHGDDPRGNVPRMGEARARGARGRADRLPRGKGRARGRDRRRPRDRMDAASRRALDGAGAVRLVPGHEPVHRLHLRRLVRTLRQAPPARLDDSGRQGVEDASRRAFLGPERARRADRQHRFPGVRPAQAEEGRKAR